MAGGLKPALLTTLAGTLANIAFLTSPPTGMAIGAEDWLRFMIFLIVSIVIAVVADRLERSNQRLRISLQAERESQARIRAITEGVAEALVLVSPYQEILNVNRRFVELFGVPAERGIGQRLADVRTLYDQVFDDAEVLYGASVAASADTEHDLSRLVVQKWPQARELLHYSTPIRDDGEFLGRLFVFRDVTHEREVDRMKTEFVSLVSHELRTPLTAIKGFTQMVLDWDAGEIDDEVAEFLGVSLRNTDRLVALVNDLLDISRIESGRLQLKSEPVDLDEVVRDG